MIQSIIAFILLCAPTFWEINDDKRGDLNKKEDVAWRILGGCVVSICAWVFADKNPWLAFNMSMAIFFLFFDYLISYILIHNGTIELPRGSKYTWFNYTAKSGFVDRVPWWSKLNPWIKLLIRVTYFSISAILYFKS